MGDPAAAETGALLATPDQAEAGGAGYESFMLSYGGLGEQPDLGWGVVAAQMWVMPLSTCSRAAQVQRAHAQPLCLAL